MFDGPAAGLYCMAMFPRRYAAWAAVLLITLSAAAAQPRYEAVQENASGAGTPKLVVLRDRASGVEAAIAPSEGGELTSFRVRIREQWNELIYKARQYSNEPGFRGKAPLLWPAVGGQYLPGTQPRGSCADGEYQVDGKTYPMPCHGFAKAMAWELVSAAAGAKGAKATVRLRDSEATRKWYPFAFDLRATYELSEGKLEIRYDVTAGRNHTPMMFSIGNHIAFALPFLPGTDPSAMMFETPSTAAMLRNSMGVLSGEKEARSFAKPVRLDEFSATTAIPLVGYASDEAFARVSDPQGLALRISHRASSIPREPVVRFNVFGGPKQGYLSPEPWVGLQNSLNSKRGLISLAPGRTWTWTIVIAPEARKGRT